MIEVDLRDNHLAENINAIMELKKTGMFSENDIQKMYDRQVEKDRKSEIEKWH